MEKETKDVKRRSSEKRNVKANLMMRMLSNLQRTITTETNDLQGTTMLS